jgi:hypothetical protein
MDTRKMKIASTLVAAAALYMPVAARADCAYEIEKLTPRVAHVTDKAKRALVNKYLNKAIAEQPNDEAGCLNNATRARRALAEQPPPTAKPPEERPRVRGD